MVHDTAIFVVPVTVAVSCFFNPALTWAVVGETLTATGGMTVIEAVADFVGSIVEVAVTDTCAGLGTADGAV